jgi:hypothetical protein
LAVEQDHISVAEILIINGAKIDARYGVFGRTPLYFAKSSEMVNLLKQHGAKHRMYFWAEIIFFVFAIFEKLVAYGLFGSIVIKIF